MKLSEAIQYINTALNYPALTYTDIDLFFDMAIAELNTTLHTSLPTIKSLVEEYGKQLLKSESNKLILTADPADTDYEIPHSEVDLAPSLSRPVYWNYTTRKFNLLNVHQNTYTEYDTVKAIYVDESGKIHMYQAISFDGGESAIWAEIPADPNYDCELSDILPDDWVLLWLIPYVCFKYTCRDGGTAQTFAEELTQGYQQLQETYDVPDKVVLATYADKPVYTKIVEKYLPYVNVVVPTRGIFENMKHSRNTNARYGGFYDRGGF